jgi:hypothetical protein
MKIKVDQSRLIESGSNPAIRKLSPLNSWQLQITQGHSFLAYRNELFSFQPALTDYFY